MFKKCPIGITSYNELSSGGLPCARPALVTGQSCVGKTLFAMGFILNGIEWYQEPDVFLSFEESHEDLALNIVSLGHDLPQLEREGLLRTLHLQLDQQGMIEAGELDLDGIFLQLGPQQRQVPVHPRLKRLFDDAGRPGRTVLSGQRRACFGRHTQLGDDH